MVKVPEGTVVEKMLSKLRAFALVLHDLICGRVVEYKLSEKLVDGNAYHVLSKNTEKTKRIFGESAMNHKIEFWFFCNYNFF